MTSVNEMESLRAGPYAQMSDGAADQPCQLDQGSGFSEGGSSYWGKVLW
jgi:hypothetical protein